MVIQPEKTQTLLNTKNWLCWTASFSPFLFVILKNWKSKDCMFLSAIMGATI